MRWGCGHKRQIGLRLLPQFRTDKRPTAFLGVRCPVSARAFLAAILSLPFVWSLNLANVKASHGSFGDQTLAKLAIIGTGAPAGTVALFGHAFAAAQIGPGETVALQRVDDGSRLPTQFNPITTWPDGSVKVGLLAAEVPAVAPGQQLEVVLVKDGASSPGPPLNLQEICRGRTAHLTIVVPGKPAWMFDILRAAGDKDRWHNGPLAVSTRVETRVPAEVVGVTSLRLVVDIIATKDGILELDTRLANDLVMKVGGGPARYGYKVTIDGVDVYEQEPATHIQYTAWVRRHGRARSGPMPERPCVRPDLDLLVRAGVTLPWDRSLPSRRFREYIEEVIAREKPFANTAYPAWGITRYAGAAGGRPEIGYRTYPCMVWLKTGAPAAQYLAHRQLEVGFSRPQNLWDDELGTWLNPEDWPKFTAGVPEQNFSPAGTPRQEARGFPPDQRPAANEREHVTITCSHNPEYWSVPAVCSGRRMAFDGMAMNAAWVTMQINDRQRPEYHMDWRQLPMDYKTGMGWAPRLGCTQTRSFAWAVRDMSLAAALLPDNYPRREFYNRNIQAWINTYGVNLDTLCAEQGELAGWVPHTNLRTHCPNFMMSFVIYAVLDAVRLGVAGPHGLSVLAHFARFRVNCFNSPEFNWRNAASGKDIYIGDGKNLFTKWAQAQARHVELQQDIDPEWSRSWPGEGDWQRNVLASLAILRDAPIPLELRAKAVDGMVLFRSERPRGPHKHPRINPEEFFDAFENLNSVCPEGSTWRWDVPPLVRAGQRFVVENPTPGQIVGIVITDGGLPRASRPEGDDAFVIVSQPPGSPFAISRGGVLRLVGKPPKGEVRLEIFARTFDGEEREHRGPTVPVTVVFPTR
ncbi:MAG: hypothetical protein NZ899_08185 [Thermoguttaceae bacterium]|nr:hypothetical protein [Thermoguttaceae bacterium]MDW8078076.1 hypothetical protein [Thermoguttaceae bacterium]